MEKWFYSNPPGVTSILLCGFYKREDIGDLFNSIARILMAPGENWSPPFAARMTALFSKKSSTNAAGREVAPRS